MRKAQVSLQRQELIALLQDIHFGSIERLLIRDGEPILRPPPTIVRDIALGKPRGPHPASGLADFALRNELTDLFKLFDEERDTTIERVVVQAGLPHRVILREQHGDS
ncbi:MAG TPA: hypothetical protein VJQ57_09210 [Acidimicrobiia bacterium]|nr:hypothetical protein [Acidimicrobiia bacterium]